MHLAAAKEDAVSIHDTFSIERNENAVDVAALTRALDAGQVDVAVHWLQLLLMESGDQDHPLTKRRKTIKHTRVRRLKTLQNAVAQMLRDYDKDREEDSLTLRPGLATAVCELSYSQLQMFALQRMRPSSTAYNVVRALQFTDVPLDLAALESACNALVAKHEALRTCFDVDASAGAQPRQIVHPLSHFHGELGVFRVVQSELLTLLDSSSDAELAAVVAKVADEPFDLARQAPIRVYAVVSLEQSSTPWVLAVVLHHIATDAASSQLFWNDFHTLYDRFLHSENAMVSTAEVIRQLEVEASSGSRVTYRDFAVWQRSRMRSGVLAPALQYWMQQLTESGAPPLLELPFDSGSTIASVELNAPESSTTKGDVGASMFMGLLAVFYLLIGRLSGQQDFVIGAPSSGRGLADLQDVMGYFVNTLPLRLGVKCSEDADFTEFLFSVREVVLGAYNHMEIPIHKVLEHLRATAQSDRDVGGDAERRWQHPLFQIMFSWEHSDDSSDSKKYVELSLPHQSAKFDLMLSMRYRRLKGAAVGDRVLEGSMEFPTDRFTRDTVERFTGYYLTLLEQVTHAPTAIVRSPSIRMLSESEQRQLVSKWGMPKPAASSSSSSNKPSSNFLDECLLAQVQKTQHNPALHFEGAQWTYRELWSHSGRVASALCMIDVPGCAAELHIGLLLDRGLENVAAMVGVLRLKGVFVPLDPEFPRERLRYMARDSGVHVIITQRKHYEIARYLSSPITAGSEDDDDLSPCVLCYEYVDALTSRDEPSRDDTRFQYRDSRDPHKATAYILYTSGSTGNPKGVVVPHAALMTTLWWTVRTYEVTSDDVFLQSTSTTLDGSLSQLFSPLLVGASARITRPKGLHELHYMRNVLLGAPHITFCVFVPSYFALIVDFLSDKGDSFPTSVKHVVLAGKAFPIELARQFYRKHQESTTCLVNEYGPTEASITSTAFRLPRELALQGTSSPIEGLQSVPIGKPIDNHPVVVLDAQRRLVPVNVHGELYIGGAGVARGYWHRPELTAKAFIAHEKLQEIASIVPMHGRTWYKTGDLAKWLPSGDLIFLGRTDAQVKHHGMRIELQEVRNVLLRHASVKAAEVLSISQPKSPGHKQRQDLSTSLVAFIMLTDCVNDRSPGEGYLDNIRAYLRDYLPVHMVPQSIRVVSSWPRTPNGKIDLRALAGWAGDRSCDIKSSRSLEPQRATVDGSTITVQFAVDILRQVWTQALGLDHLNDDEGVDADELEDRLMTRSFFELGGDSLAAIRAIALAQARGLSLTLEQFFRTSSLPEMAHSAAASMMDLREWTSQTLVPLNWLTTKSS
ncbi:Tyrocidine synthase 2, partial [Phytophthora fragariae]